MSSSSSLPDTQLASLIDRPNFYQLGFRWAITPPGTGPSSFPAPVEAPPTWGLGLTCQWGKKMHSDTFNASQPSAYDSAWFTSMSVQQLHQFHIISQYSDTIQILFRSIQTHLLCPFSSFQEFLKVGEVGHSVGTGHHPCTSSCRRVTSSQALCLTASPVIRPMILHYTSHHMSSTVQYCHLVLFTTWLLPSHKRYSTYVYIWYVRPQPIFQPKGAQHISSMQPPITSPSVKPTRLDQLAAHFLQWLLPQLFGCCKWGVKHRKHHQSHQTNWIKLDQIGSTYGIYCDSGKEW